MIIRKTAEQIELMAQAGRALAEVIVILRNAVRPGVTPVELNDLAETSMRERGALPSFLDYRGFPASICSSPNDTVVHGIPDDRPLQTGDIYSADFGLILDGWHADSAWTFPVGEVSEEARRLMEVTQRALDSGIAQCRVGARLGDVGFAVQEVVDSSGFSLVEDFVGHGIGRSLHEDPPVPNRGRPGRGPVIEEGWVLCVEPMVNAGGRECRLLADRWGVVTADGSLSAHYEHTIAVTSSGPRVLTDLG